MKLLPKHLITALAIPLAVGALSAALTGDAMRSFSEMAQPPLSPPGWLFPIVWTILYLLMGAASYLIVTSSQETDLALVLYAAQLLFNFLWSIWFFGLHWYLFAFFWLIALWILIFSTIKVFAGVSKNAALLLVPYLLWTTFAGYLNLGVYLLNL